MDLVKPRGVRVSVGFGNCSLHHRVQNGSGFHPASYPICIRGSFPESKATGAWSWPLTSKYCRGQRIRGAIPPLPQYASMAWCSVKAQGQRRNLIVFNWTWWCGGNDAKCIQEVIGSTLAWIVSYYGWHILWCSKWILYDTFCDVLSEFWMTHLVVF
jgi:hypothetical protein